MSSSPTTGTAVVMPSWPEQLIFEQGAEFGAKAFDLGDDIAKSADRTGYRSTSSLNAVRTPLDQVHFVLARLEQVGGANEVQEPAFVLGAIVGALGAAQGVEHV